MTKIVPIHGTFSAKRFNPGAWYREGSPLHGVLKAAGYEYVNPTDPFEWSSDLDGAWIRRDHGDWEAGGKALRWYLHDIPFEDRNLLTHSHGLQVSLYAAAAGTQIRSLISITGPVRGDMEDVTKAAINNIGPWLHVYTDKSDLIQLLGSLFDGKFGIHRKAPFADVNLKIPKVGHSGLLSDPQKIPLLLTDVLPFFRSV